MVQVDEMVRKLAENVYLLRNIICNCDEEILRRVYFAHFQSISAYGFNKGQNFKNYTITVYALYVYQYLTYVKNNRQNYLKSQ